MANETAESSTAVSGVARAGAVVLLAVLVVSGTLGAVAPASAGPVDAPATPDESAGQVGSIPDTSAGGDGPNATDPRECDDTIARRTGTASARSFERARGSFGVTVEGDCRIRVSVRPSDGPAPGTDIDLYVTLDGRRATANDHDRRSTTPGSVESVEVGADQLNEGTTIGVTVVAYTGSANVTVTVEQVAPGGGPAPPGGARDTAVVWRGFRHAWSYNHRAPRIGSWVDHGTCNATGCTYAVGHSGASGSGSDRASFRDAYTELSARGVGFASGSVEFDVAGKEQLGGNRSQVIEGTRVVSVPANGTLAGRDDHVALINGFDLVADGVPMKFVSLNVHATQPRVEDGRIRFRVNYRTLLDCDSVECPGWLGKNANDVDYTLRVQYLLAGGDRESLNVVPAGTVSQDYGWKRCRNNPAVPTAWFSARDRHDRGFERAPNSVYPGNHMNCENSADRELDYSDHVTERTVGTPRDYGVAVPGIRGFSLRLDQEAHFTQYDTVVGGSYDRAGGHYDLRALAFFKEWSSRPGQNADAWGAYGHSGGATVSVDPVVLQVGAGCKRSFVHGGGIQFRTDRRDVAPPSKPSAAVESRHGFEYGTGWRPGAGTECRTGSVPSPTVRRPAFWVDVWDERRRDVAPDRASVEDPTRFRYEYSSRFYNRSD